MLQILFLKNPRRPLRLRGFPYYSFQFSAFVFQLPDLPFPVTCPQPVTSVML